MARGEFLFVCFRPLGIENMLGEARRGLLCSDRHVTDFIGGLAKGLKRNMKAQQLVPESGFIERKPREVEGLDGRGGGGGHRGHL